jgi:membrane associated rhomboid family serine protease
LVRLQTRWIRCCELLLLVWRSFAPAIFFNPPKAHREIQEQKVSRYYRSSSSNIGYPPWSRAVRMLIITCVIVFVLQTFDDFAGGHTLIHSFGLTPFLVVHNFYFWQLVTYIFLHGGILHILFNMLGLWMFGSDLERLWGAQKFTIYFFVCGVGAGLFTVLLSPSSPVATIGASGAIYGILLAFGMLFPNRIIYWIIFPIRAKWFVLIMGGLAFYSSLSANDSGIANIAHLGGMLFGLLYLKGGNIAPGLRWKYEQWQRQRLRRKFDVYYNEKHRKDDDSWRN